MKFAKILILSSCLFLSNVFADQPDKEDGEYLISGIIIKYTDEYNSKSPKQLREKAERVAEVKLKYVEKGPSGFHLLRLKNKKIKTSRLRKITRKLTSHEDVVSAEPNIWVEQSSIPNDPEYYRQWHYSELMGGAKLPAAWDKSTGSGAVVAILDTGYLPHSDLNGRILPGYDFVPVGNSNDGDGYDADATDPGNWTDTKSSNWHGTHVAGTVAAVTNNFTGVAGVAYNAKIVPVRVLGVGGGEIWRVAMGIHWAIGESFGGYPVNSNPANVINLSLSAPSVACGFSIGNAIVEARKAGAVVIVAAGNNGEDASSRTPANCADAITVGSNTRTATKASYSNFGDIVDLSAPGGNFSTDGVYSTSNTGTTIPVADTYSYMNGTSMAAPHVSGVAALLYSLRPDIDNETVELILTHSAKERPVVGCSNCGTGILDAESAVSMVCTTRSYTTKEQDFTKAYLAYMGRVPDPGGLDWHVANTSGNDITPRMPTFINNDEFTTLFGVSYGSIVTAHYVNFVHYIYSNLFGHLADGSGLIFYVDLLEAGTETIDTIGLRIANSASGSDASVLNNRLALSEHYVDQQKDAGNPSSPSGTILRSMTSAILDVDTVMLDGCAEANNLVW